MDKDRALKNERAWNDRPRGPSGGRKSSARIGRMYCVKVLSSMRSTRMSRYANLTNPSPIMLRHRMDQIVDQPTPSLALCLSSLEEVARVGMRHQIELKTYDLDLIREIVKLVWTFQSFEEIL